MFSRLNKKPALYRETDPRSLLLAWGLDGGAQAAAVSPVVGQPVFLSHSLPRAAHGVGLHSRPASPRVTARPHAPSRAFSLFLMGRCRREGAGGSMRLELAPD